MVTPNDAGLWDSDYPDGKADAMAIAQQRRSLTAAAIRRGEKKISEPILWVAGVPEAAPSDGHFVSKAVEQESINPNRLPMEHSNDEHLPGIAVSTDEAMVHTETPSATAVPLRQTPSVEAFRESKDLSSLVGDNADGTLERNRNIFVEDPSMSSPLSEKKKVRRSGTIRTVFRKVFGRREKRQSKILETPLPRTETSRPGIKHEYTKSDPLPADRSGTSPVRRAQARSSSRAASFAQDDLGTHGHQLHTPVPQTLPFPMNVNGPQPTLPRQNQPEPEPTNYSTVENRPQVRQRRATLPSKMLTPEESATIHKIWSTADMGDLPPNEQSYRESSVHLMPSPSIGVAISYGDSHTNRRSKSVGALYTLSREQEPISSFRRRSSEIRRWRRSNVASFVEESRGSVIYGAGSRPRSSSIVKSSVQAQTDVSEVFGETDSSAHDKQFQSFDFGSVTTNPSSTDKHANYMEQRLSHLEAGMRRLSAEVQGYAARGYTEIAVREKAPIQRNFSLSSSAKQQQPSTTFSSTYRSVSAAALNPNREINDTTHRSTSLFFRQPRPAPSSSVSSISLHRDSSPKASAHDLSTKSPPYSVPTQSTIPPAPSSVRSAPEPASHIHNTVASAQFHSSDVHAFTDSSYRNCHSRSEDNDVAIPFAAPSPSQRMVQRHIEPLIDALLYERQTRKALEAQVLQLQNDMLELNAVVSQLKAQAIYVKQSSHSSVSGLTASPPRGSPDTSAARAFRGFNANMLNERSRFSGYDSDDETTNDCVRAPLKIPQETWTTPMEERNAWPDSDIENEIF